MSAMREKREYPRVPIEIFVHENGSDEYYIHPVVNISPEGIHLVVDGVLEEDRLSSLEFTLPNGGRTIVVSARVAWYEPQDEAVFRVGLHFTEISPEDRLAIEAYVESFQNAQLPDVAAAL